MQLVFNAVFCLTLLGAALWALYAEYNRPWKQYQKTFNRMEYGYTAKLYQTMLLQKDGVSEKDLLTLKNKLSLIQNRGKKIKQLWLRDLGETDRCITCHQAVNKPGFENISHPFRTHSGDYLKHHPVERFGCVICHEGQGVALTVKAAHGYTKNWTKPILNGAYIQSSCSKCHFMDQGLPFTAELTGAPVFTKGRKIFMQNNCLGCHKLTGYKKPDRVAPSLTYTGDKINRDWLIKWLRNPKDYLPKTRMPRFDLSDKEIGYVADYLMSLDSVPGFRGHAGGFKNNSLVEEGENLFNTLGCPGCHKINGKGNDFGPGLSNIGGKVKSDWLYEFLKKPKSYDPKTIAPDFRMPEKEIPALAAYLMSLKKNEKPVPLTPSPDKRGRIFEGVEKGKKIVRDYGCTGCHEIETLPFQYNAPELDGIGDKRVDELVFNNLNDAEKTLTGWLEVKVREPGRFATDRIVTRMPDYNFNEEQTKALVVFLLSIKDKPVSLKYRKTLVDPDRAEMRGGKILEKYNCTGCHKISGKGVDIGPELTYEGKKSRPEWLFAFLKRPHKIRPEPILKAGMPDFNLSDEEVNTIIEYLSFISGESYPYDPEPKKEIYPEEIPSGEKLYQEVFACSGCHTVNGTGGEIGPDHTDIASRLKREWIEQWLKNPLAVKPGVRMPRFKFRDWEFEALTDYLMTLGQYRFVQVKGAD